MNVERNQAFWSADARVLVHHFLRPEAESLAKGLLASERERLMPLAGVDEATFRRTLQEAMQAIGECPRGVDEQTLATLRALGHIASGHPFCALARLEAELAGDSSVNSGKDTICLSEH